MKLFVYLVFTRFIPEKSLKNKTMLTHNFGYPRIGSCRELKKACERYWSGAVSFEDLLSSGKKLRIENMEIQKKAGLDILPCNDFSFYDSVLDVSLMVSAIPERFSYLYGEDPESQMKLYFAMARGYQKGDIDLPAMEMTKWFDTNYHYIVPEFTKNQSFSLFSDKIIREYKEASSLGFKTKPVLLGPVSYLLLGKEKEPGFHRLELLDKLIPVYLNIFRLLEECGAEWIQLDEPFLVTDLDEKTVAAYKSSYDRIASGTELNIMMATYFGGIGDNMEFVKHIPVNALHIDLVRAPESLNEILKEMPSSMQLSLGVVDGRNIWKNDIGKSAGLVSAACKVLGEDRVWIGPSCSMLHVPVDLDQETDESILPVGVKGRMSFAKQKVFEIVEIADIIKGKKLVDKLYKKQYGKIAEGGNLYVREKIDSLTDSDFKRESPYPVRKKVQSKKMSLPLFPTTTIGSFPQTKEVRSVRVKYRRGEIDYAVYVEKMRSFIKECIEFQEKTGIDVLVHGEFERTDMVEYFGEKLEGFAFTKNGWVQSYGSRCVKPPVIYGDVSRSAPMTVDWSVYARSLTKKPVKGMLTGPITILEWSFVRDDQPRSQTALQIALAIREEVSDLEEAGINIIQVDEPALREGLPLREADKDNYLKWAVRAFKLSTSGVRSETQIHTHMCYAEFNDIIEAIAALDSDVITIETSRSQMELLDAFVRFRYPNDIGPGVYDIHSPRVPSVEEMVSLLRKALKVIPPENLWVNPDCGLKTRGWEETELSLENMVKAAEILRKEYLEM